MKKYHFISGLPRSGSTLLTSILNQNPNFSSQITNPVLSYCESIIRDINIGYHETPDKDYIKRMLYGIFDSHHYNDNNVSFNTHRLWPRHLNLLNMLFPDFKMIICFRDISWILDSFELLNSKSPHVLKLMYGDYNQLSYNVYDRCDFLMDVNGNGSDNITLPLLSFQSSVHSQYTNNILYIEYDYMVKNIDATMKKIYEFLGEDFYQHNFNDVEMRMDEYDLNYKFPDLHYIRKKVEYIDRKPIIPIEVWERFQNYNFWKKSEYKEIIKKLNWLGDTKDEKKNINYGPAWSR